MDDLQTATNNVTDPLQTRHHIPQSPSLFVESILHDENELTVQKESNRDGSIAMNQNTNTFSQVKNSHGELNQIETTRHIVDRE